MVDEEHQDSAEAVAEQDVAETPEDMKEIIDVSVADAGVLRKAITVTVPTERIQQERDKQYKELLNDALVPGFRKGHAPRRLIEKRFGGEVGDQILTKMVSTAYMAAIEKQGLKALGDPMFRIAAKESQQAEKAPDSAEAPAGDTPPAETTASRDRLVDFNTALEELKLPEDGPLTFTCEVEIKPEFELPELENIPVEKPQVKITDDDVANQIDRLRRMRGEYVPVTEGGIESDDMVIADIKQIVGGETIAQHENVTLAARPQRVLDVTLQNLGDVLIGAKPGDVRTIEGKMPDEAEREDLRGKPVTFEVKINDIKRMRLPALDKEFLTAQGFDSEDEMRSQIRTGMERQLDQEIRRGMRGQIYKYLLDQTKLDLPADLSARQVDRAVIRRIVDLRRQGVPMSEIEKHADELRTSTGDRALSELKLHFITEKIAEKLEVEVSEEELNSQIAAIARHYGRRFDRVRDELAKEEGLENLYLQIRDEKVVDRLLDQAKITDTAGPATSVSDLAEAT